MARGERDQVDPRLIVDGQRKAQPSKRIQGLDYPQTVTQPSKKVIDGEGHAETHESNEAPCRSEQPKPKQNLKICTFFKDPTKKLEGEALNPDGTLKDVSEMQFVHSPSELEPRGRELLTLKQSSEVDTDSEDRISSRRSKKRKRGLTIPNTDVKENSLEDLDEPIDSDEGRDEEFEQGTLENEENDEEEVEDDKDDGIEYTATEIENREKFMNVLKNGRMKQTATATRKSHKTRDVRLFYRESVRMINDEEIAGYYCMLCLNGKPLNGGTIGWQTGNITARRRHLGRKHYEKYLDICKQKGAEPKASPPLNWRPSKRFKQQNISTFAKPSMKPPKVTKEGLLEHLLEVVVDCDLPFRIVDRHSLRRLLLYCNPQLTDEKIPHKSTIATAIDEKVQKLDDIDSALLSKIPSHIAVTWDGWSTKRRRPFTALGAHFIAASPDNPNEWSLQSILLSFQSSPGRHSGKVIGDEVVAVLRKFGIENKVGAMVGDNVAVNDVVVRHVCQMLDPKRQRLVAKQIRGRCINHTVNLMCVRFVKALGIPAAAIINQQIHGPGAANLDDESDELGSSAEVGELWEKDAELDDDEPTEGVDPESVDEYEEELDVDTSQEIEATADDEGAMLSTLITEFDAGDVTGKLMAFINQMRASGEPTRMFLKELCVSNGCSPLEIKLWVRTRWTSLSDCFETVLTMKKAIDIFCFLADDNQTIPPLRKPKKWLDFKLTAQEWRIIERSYECLKMPASIFSELSADKTPTAHKVYPLIEGLLSDWSEKMKDPKYEMIHHALSAGVANMKKWYRTTGDTMMYFIAHVLDPTRKLSFLDAVWSKKELQKALTRFKKIYLQYHSNYASLSKSIHHVQVQTATVKKEVPRREASGSLTDIFMDKLIQQKKKLVPEQVASPQLTDPLEEFKRYFSRPLVSVEDCSNMISWWGHQGAEYPIMQQIARDFLPIPASSCFIERAFSLSARTDSARRGQMVKTRFGSIQRLRNGYAEGRLQVAKEVWIALDADFDYNSSMEL